MGFFSKVKQALSKTTAQLGTWLTGGKVDEAFLEELGDALLQADVGLPVTEKLVDAVRQQARGKELSADELKTLLQQEIATLLTPCEQAFNLPSKQPAVLFMVGVNGSGKTTTLGKLAAQWGRERKKVHIAAADTFRAAAVEQLQHWADKAKAQLTAPTQDGADPASLVYRAYDEAKAHNADVLIVDTAGRLQNRSDLMEQLGKMVRVVQKHDADAPDATLLVLDATVGQNAIQQVRAFKEVAQVTGLIITKLDSSAKGGVVLALAEEFALPIHYLGLGEGVDDLQNFNANDFAEALLSTT